MPPPPSQGRICWAGRCSHLISSKCLVQSLPGQDICSSDLLAGFHPSPPAHPRSGSMPPHYSSALCAVRPLRCQVPPPASCHAGLPCSLQNLALPRTWYKWDPPVQNLRLGKEILNGKQIALTSLYLESWWLSPLSHGSPALIPTPLSMGAPHLGAASHTHELL